MTSPIPSSVSCRFLAWFLRHAGNRHQIFRPRVHCFANELLSRFQNGPSIPFSSRSLHSLLQWNWLRKVNENLYLFEGSLPPRKTPETFDEPLDSPRQFFLVNIEDLTNLRCHSLPLNEVLCLFRHKGLFKECHSSVLRRFRQIHAFERKPGERLVSSGNLIVCLAQVGAALFPGKPGTRMALRLIRKFQKESMLISKDDLLRVQQILLLQSKNHSFQVTNKPTTPENMMNLQHARALSSIYPFPPSPPPAGKMPEVYLQKLSQPLAASLRSDLTQCGYGQAITSVNDRTVVRKICQDANVNPFGAYIVAMAWGGQGPYNFTQTLNCQPQIGTLLRQLRVSVNSRAYDFAQVQKAAETIGGLNISFYTKLLYFFRSTPDAYILDKWTAMASFLLFVPQPIRLGPPDSRGHCGPKTNTTAQEYDQFCNEIDKLSGFLWPGSPIPGDVGELATFGVPPIPGNKLKKWRKYVESKFIPPPPPQPKSKGTPKALLNAFLVQLYPEHMAGGRNLPSSIALIKKPALATLVNSEGAKWVYDPAGTHVRVFKHYTTAAGLKTYQRDLCQTTTLQKLAQANGWGFITINGASPGLGFKILGNTASIRVRTQIIAKCVQAMRILYATIP